MHAPSGDTSFRSIAATKIFGIGLSRTGTTSLAEALERLGFRAVHFPCDRQTRTELVAFLDGGGESLTLSVLEAVDALTDTPICCAYAALDRAYPDSKFILTTRDEEAWLSSCAAHWSRLRTPFVRRHARMLRTRLRQVTRREQDIDFRRYVRRINEAIYGDPHPDLERFRQTRRAYEAEAQEYFSNRPNDFLVMDICAGEGWEVLCPFLEVEAPDQPFPVSNVLATRDLVAQAGPET